jgi:hypothetical protein
MPQLVPFHFINQVSFAFIYVIFFMDYCSDPSNSHSICCLLLPVYNAYTDKLKILKENKGKSGIYM